MFLAKQKVVKICGGCTDPKMKFVCAAVEECIRAVVARIQSDPIRVIEMIATSRVTG